MDGIFGLHLCRLEGGQDRFKAGPMIARPVYIDIFGQGCLAQPHKGRDAVVAAGHIVACQTIVSRSVSPMEAAVFTIGRVDARTL